MPIGVAVVPIDKAAEILQQARRLLGTEHLVQDNIKAGATIGELVNIDEVIRMTFSYQDEASQRD